MAAEELEALVVKILMKADQFSRGVETVKQKTYELKQAFVYLQRDIQAPITAINRSLGNMTRSLNNSERAAFALGQSVSVTAEVLNVVSGSVASLSTQFDKLAVTGETTATRLEGAMARVGRAAAGMRAETTVLEVVPPQEAVLKKLRRAIVREPEEVSTSAMARKKQKEVSSFVPEVLAPGAGVAGGTVVSQQIAAPAAQASATAAESTQVGAGIAATAKAAGNASEALAAAEKGIKGVSEAISALSEITPLAMKAAAGIQMISNSVEGLTLTTGPVNQAAASFERLKSSAAGLTEVGTALQSIVTGVTSLGDLEAKMASVGKGAKDLGANLAKLPKGLENIEPAIEKLDKLGPALTKLKPHLASIKDVGRIGQLASGLDELGGSIGTGKWLKPHITKLEDIGTPLGAMGDQIAKLASAGTSLTGVGTGLTTLMTNVAALKTADVARFGALATSVEKLAPGLQGIATLQTGLNQLATDLGALGTHHSNLTKTATALDKFPTAITNITGASTGMSSFGTALKELGIGLQTVDPFVNTVGNLQTAMSGFATAWPNMKSAIGGLSKLGNYFSSIAAASTLSARDIDKVLAHLNRFGTGLPAALAPLQAANIGDSARSLSQIGNFFDGAARFGKLSDVAMQSVATGLQGIGNVIGNIAVMPNVAEAGTVFMRLGRMLTIMSKVDPNSFAPVGAAVGNFFQDINKIDATQAMGPVKALNQFQSVALRLSKVNLANMMGSAWIAKRVMAVLSDIPITGNLTNVVNLMQQVGNAMRGMARMPGGVGVPPGGINIPAGMANIPPAAQSASSSVGRLGESFRRLMSNTDAADNSLNGIKLTMLGLGVLGVVQAARLDDALTKTMAHMRDWNRELRAPLQQGLFEISGRSVTGASQLASALDILTMSGMSAGMALDALKVSEELAAASGMTVEMSTRRLVDIMNNTGLAVTDVETHLKSMDHLSDLLVGVAHKVGSTEEQLSAGFTSKFTTTLRQANMTMEDGIVLLSLYSRAGANLRGGPGGDTAARAIQTLFMKQAGGFGQQQLKMMGEGAFDAEGHMKKPLEFLDLMQQKLATLNPVQRAAQLGLMGLTDLRVVNALEPLLNRIGAVKEVRDLIDSVGGVSHKTAEMMRASMIGALKVLWNNLSNVATVIGDRAAPAINALAIGMQQFANVFTRLPSSFQDIIVWSGLLAIGLGPAIQAIGWLTSTILMAPIHLLVDGFSLVYNAIMFLPNAALFAFDVVTSSIMIAVEAMSWLFKAVGSVVNFIASIPGMIGTAYNAVVGFINSTAETVKNVLYYAFVYPFQTLISVLESVGTAIFNALKWMNMVSLAAATYLHTLITAALQGGVTIGKMLSSIGTGLTSMITSIASGAVSLLAGILPIILTIIGSIVIWLLVIGPLITLIGVAFAGVAALVVTAGIAVGQLASLIGGALVGAWNAFRNAAGDAIGWVGGQMHNMNGQVVGFWQRMRASSQEFFGDVMRGMTRMTGFFWNFQHNMDVIWDFIGKHGEEAFKDIANAAFNLIERIASNLLVIGKFAVEQAGAGIMAAFTMATRHIYYAFLWLADNWRNILADMGQLFYAFAAAVGKNFMVLQPIIVAFVRTIAQQVMDEITLSVGGLHASTATRGRVATGLLDENTQEMKGLKQGSERYKWLDKMNEHLIKVVGGKGDLNDASVSRGISLYYSKQFSDIMGKFDSSKLKGMDTSKIKFKTQGIADYMGFAQNDINVLWAKTAGNFAEAFGKAFATRNVWDEIFDQSKIIASAVPSLTTVAKVAGDTFGKTFDDIFFALFEDEWTNFNIADMLDMGGQLKSLMPAFDAFTKSLYKELNSLLKFDVPENALGQLKKTFMGTLSPGTEHSEMGDPLGKGGPGYGFKQVSLQRTMVGGDVAESLEWLQLQELRQANKSLATIAAAMGWGIHPLPDPKLK